MTPITLRRHEITLVPESARVIIRPFIPSSVHGITTIIGRALAFSEEDTTRELEAVLKEFDSRHLDIEVALACELREGGSAPLHATSPVPRAQAPHRRTLFRRVRAGIRRTLQSVHRCASRPGWRARWRLAIHHEPARHRRRAHFFRRVPHGLIAPDGGIRLDPVSRFVTVPEIDPNPSYKKTPFLVKLHEMGFDNGHTAAVMEPLGEGFTRRDLNRSVLRIRRETRPMTQDLKAALSSVQWLADSNYEMHFSPKLAMSERIIFPVSSNESNGIEDARFVRLTEDDGAVMYYATYTAYNGHAILPQLIETQDFLHFRVLTLNGTAVQNKGMAIFPRRIDGSYAMLSRQDDENLFIMFSDNPHYWSDSQVLLRPAGTVGVREDRKLRVAHRNRSRLAGDHPRRRPHAQVLHRGSTARPARSDEGHRPLARTPPGARRHRKRRLRAQRRLQLRVPGPRRANSSFPMP